MVADDFKRRSRIIDQSITRISPAHMRAKRTFPSTRIRMKLKRRTRHRFIERRLRHRRGSVNRHPIGPASQRFGCKPHRFLIILALAAPEIPERLHILLELSKHDETSVLPERWAAGAPLRSIFVTQHHFARRQQCHFRLRRPGHHQRRPASRTRHPRTQTARVRRRADSTGNLSVTNQPGASCAIISVRGVAADAPSFAYTKQQRMKLRIAPPPPAGSLRPASPSARLRCGATMPCRN